MKIALESAGGVNVIDSYAPGRIRIRGQQFTTSIIVLPHQLLPDWTPRHVDELRAAHLSPILEKRPELLILGTGDTQVFPDPGIFPKLMELRIGFEVMDNAAACRTYNIVLAEGRPAALALIIKDGGE